MSKNVLRQYDLSKDWTGAECVRRKREVRERKGPNSVWDAELVVEVLA